MCVKHLNPRQGITTRFLDVVAFGRKRFGVKHLNPRQGITTLVNDILTLESYHSCVKHLNPRQGITTMDAGAVLFPNDWNVV